MKCFILYCTILTLLTVQKTNCSRKSVQFRTKQLCIEQGFTVVFRKKLLVFWVSLFYDVKHNWNASWDLLSASNPIQTISGSISNYIRYFSSIDSQTKSKTIKFKKSNVYSISYTKICWHFYFIPLLYTSWS